MPRTKRPVKKRETVSEENDTLKELDTYLADLIKKIDSQVKMEQRNVELAFKIFLESISERHLNMTVGELKRELYMKETSNLLGVGDSSRSALNDDGYLTENSSQSSGERGHGNRLAVPASCGRSAYRRSRSAEASSRKPAPLTAAKQSQRRRSRSVYRTPAYNKNAPFTYPLITPKANPLTALTVLRQPRQGEMVVSMSGSPVMVPTGCSLKPDEQATCNILLQDGTMLSLQPKQLRQSQEYIPFSLMGRDVLGQLKTLKDNLDKVVQLGEKVIKS